MPNDTVILALAWHCKFQGYINETKKNINLNNINNSNTSNYSNYRVQVTCCTHRAYMIRLDFRYTLQKLHTHYESTTLLLRGPI